MDSPRQPLRSLIFLFIGAGSALVALLPWAITGMQLPLQNLWAADTLPGDMPFALLPFSQYFALFIASLIVIGSTIGGIVGRVVAARHPRPALLALMGGVAIVQVLALVQSAIVVSGGLREETASTLYLVALVAGTIAAILLGLGMLALIARAPKPGALLALSIAAVAFSSWLGGLFFAMGSVTMDYRVADALGAVARYAPAVIIGVAIAWCGITTIGRVIAAIVSLVVLWIGPVLVTAVNAAVGSRVLLPYPAEMLDYGLGVFRMALGLPEIWITTLGLAVAVAVVGLVGRRSIEKRRVRTGER